MNKLIVRIEHLSDQKEVFEVNKDAFGQDNEAKLVDLLRKGDTFIPELSIVAEIEGKIVGHILFTKIKIISQNGKVYTSLALAPMAVLPEYQKQGIGKELIQYGLERAKTLGFQSVIVLGHETYYPKFGFLPAENWNIKCPFEVPKEVFMALELIKDGLSEINGVVEYPKEFLEV